MITHPPPDTRSASVDGKHRGRSLSSVAPKLVAGLALLGVAMTGTAALAPEVAVSLGRGSHPDYGVIAGTGMAMILLSSVFVAYAGRVVGLGAAWVALALLTNGLVLVAKMWLIPIVFYQTTFDKGNPFFFDIGSSGYFGELAIPIFFANAVVVGIVYAVIRHRVSKALDPKGRTLPLPLLILGVLLVGIALLAAFVPLDIQLAGYISIVTPALSGAIDMVTLIALFGLSSTLSKAADTSIRLRDTAVVSTVFWLVISMLLVYHVVWVVLMTGLVGVWPLKILAPSGK